MNPTKNPPPHPGDSETLRAVIRAYYRRPEQKCVHDLIARSRIDANLGVRIEMLALTLVAATRSRPATAFSMNDLMQEFSLSSDEGVALMCLAEAMLRIPDKTSADALIHDKISSGKWRRHIGSSRSLLVNAAACGLTISGGLLPSGDKERTGTVPARLVAAVSRPVIRSSIGFAMRLMGRHFVAGRTIDEALRNCRSAEVKGYCHSFDMLGEAALTHEDAERYFCAYESAIHSIGRSSSQQDHISGPGISLKLSALHPRYTHLQRDRVMKDLLPRLLHLARLAHGYCIGLTIDAEEADRVELSLDLFEAIARDETLRDYSGLGLVVQAYGKRAPAIIDWLQLLARQRGTSLTVRLVKGAYWDSEIKRAQIDSMEDFPVFTRKVHTDVSYIACARQLLAAIPLLYPQFATHNALTVATVVVLAEGNQSRDFEFQCLHGMGETLYDQATRPDGPIRSCRIYAPVGSHETLLPYLVRRLLENGANSSFVNRLADPEVSPATLVADPVAAAELTGGTPHPAIAHPSCLFSAPGIEDRLNSIGFDISSDDELRRWTDAWQEYSQVSWRVRPLIANDVPVLPINDRTILNPADNSDQVGTVGDAGMDLVDIVISAAAKSLAACSARPATDRAAALRKAADLLEANRFEFFTLAIREAGKTLVNAIAEVREAVDFLRYYSTECERYEAAPAVGIVVCISPWNFPLAIFLGQVGAALAAGNAVIAKPAEQTPLIAGRAVELLYEAGIPRDTLQFLPGTGEIVGAALVADPRVAAVAFTGSTAVARLIAQTHLDLFRHDGQQRILVAETGGQNAMVIDSSALPEQVVNDAIVSAFDSAGQRCSALRVLCIQDDIADRIVAQMKGVMDELVIGNPSVTSTDIGPLIDASAMHAIDDYVEQMRSRGCSIYRHPLPANCRSGTYAAPALIEISSLDQLDGEKFGPVLHILRFQRKHLDSLVDSINAMGYGLTFGIHSRIDETIRSLAKRVRAGNIYINRNLIGAVVGMQPFGGCGMSGTGPKAGGPLYLPRFLRYTAPRLDHLHVSRTDTTVGAFQAFIQWARQSGFDSVVRHIEMEFRHGPYGLTISLPGPTGESNSLSFHPRGSILIDAQMLGSLIRCMAMTLGTGNRIALTPRTKQLLDKFSALLPAAVADMIDSAHCDTDDFDAILHDGMGTNATRQRVFHTNGAIIPVLEHSDPLSIWRLVIEQCVSVNTAASGGNASLLSLDD